VIPARALGTGTLPDPARSSLEWAVLFSAVALLVPAAVVPALGFVARARRRGSPRWRTLLGAAAWCALLGVVFRLVLGLEVLP
jgi:hypothetical protein